MPLTTIITETRSRLAGAFTPLAGARTQLSQRRTERRAHRQLCAELAAFQTPAERAELDLILSRHPEGETAQIRDILNQQESDRQRAWPLGVGR